MAGYIMTLGSNEYLDMFYSKDKSKRMEGMKSSKKNGEKKAKVHALEKCFYDGVYSARSKEKGSAFIGTLADYLGMKEGDDIFFFMNRQIFGIGKLVNVEDVDCRFRVHSKSNKNEHLLIETKDPAMHQFVCTFKPEPHFFRKGVDMDEVLLFGPEKIKSLRFFSKLTFMKLDDIESSSIRNAIARKNEDCLQEYDSEKHFKYSEKTHDKICEFLNNDTDNYRISVFDYIDKKKKVSSEYYIEGLIMDLLRRGESKYLGKWDFIGRQFPASPSKPPEYAEYMDLFGYRYVSNKKFPGAISKYIVIELKTGQIKEEHIQQTMKYVDWVSREYAKGDYSMIEAFTIGYDLENGLEEKIHDITQRSYILEGHPIKNEKWNNLRFLSYKELMKELEEKERKDVE